MNRIAAPSCGSTHARLASSDASAPRQAMAGVTAQRTAITVIVSAPALLTRIIVLLPA